MRRPLLDTSNAASEVKCVIGNFVGHSQRLTRQRTGSDIEGLGKKYPLLLKQQVAGIRVHRFGLPTRSFFLSLESSDAR